MRWRLAAGLAALLGAALLVAGVALPLLSDQYRRLARARHAARGETELRIANPAGATLSLRRARDHLDDYEAISLAGESVWLPEGRHFVEASLDARRQLFPVTLDGGVQGPEPDGSCVVTVRRPSLEEPPCSTRGSRASSSSPGATPS